MAGNAEATLVLRIKQVGQEILDRFVITLGDVKDMAYAVADAVMASIEAYREEELAINQLTQSMMNQGVFTGELRQEYIDMASALQKVTTYGDEQIISSQAIIQAQLGNKKVTRELMEATLDLAAAKGMDLASAAELVGKAIGGNTAMLARYGIKVKESSDDTQRLANITEALNGKFAGQAAAMAKGLGGMDQLKNTWSDFLEKVGALMAPFVMSLARGAAAAIDFFAAMLPNKLDASKASIKDLNSEMDKVSKKITELHAEAAKRKAMFTDDFDLRMQIKTNENRMAELVTAQTALQAQERQAADTSVQITKDKHSQEAVLRAEKNVQDITYAQEQALLEQDLETAKGMAKLQLQMRILDGQIKNEENFFTKKRLLADRADLIEKIGAEKKAEEQKKRDDEMVKNRASTLSTISTLQNSNNQALAIAGKAAAIAQIAMDTPVAIGRALSAFPPPFNFAAAGLVGAAMAAQAARVAGVQLAEGGIVKATPGGIQATIGEGGRDEAVIPLENGQIPGSGGGMTVNFYGSFLGDETQAMEVAKVIDRAFLKLKQTNQSVSFDSEF